MSSGPVPKPNINVRPYQDLLYLVVIADDAGPRVLCSAPNIESAEAVAISNIKWNYWQIYTTKHWTNPDIRSTDFDDLEFVYSLRKDKKGVSPILLPLSDAIDLRPSRTEAKIRTRWHDSLLADCVMALRLSGENPVLTNFIDSVSHELSKCDDKNNVYPNSILDYASIQCITPLAAFAELSMHATEINSARIRNYAIYMRFRNEMNNAPATNEALGNVMSDARNFLTNNRLL
jgi:hypothetical protein